MHSVPGPSVRGVRRLSLFGPETPRWDLFQAATESERTKEQLSSSAVDWLGQGCSSSARLCMSDAKSCVFECGLLGKDVRVRALIRKGVERRNGGKTAEEGT